MMTDFVIYCSIVLGLVISPEEGTVVLNLNFFLAVRKALMNIDDFTHVTVGQIVCVAITWPLSRSPRSYQLLVIFFKSVRTQWVLYLPPD